MAQIEQGDERQETQGRARAAINREKGREVDTPTTIEEQVQQLDDSGEEGHRRRDPLNGARQQMRESTDKPGPAQEGERDAQSME
ncbi:MAG: hypothetical protein JWM90_2962 [Thermoleophilia bacterium]|nr:hypothetical protein [Thermoleophilia bacterium]